MPRLQYGQTTIEWRFKADATLKRHYVTVERGRPVLLRGPAVAPEEQEALVRQRARWIREKRTLVEAKAAYEQIVTGSRLLYCGRTYFTEVKHLPKSAFPTLRFTASRFVIESPYGPCISHEALAPLLDAFYRSRAEEKLLARVRQWEQRSGLRAAGARIKHFQSRWASCNAQNILEFHPRVMELPATVQDYVVVHELCHTAEKGHTKAFWQLVSKQLPNWHREHLALEAAAFGAAI
jgi:predicted metal-dependent hydrolase